MGNGSERLSVRPEACKRVK